MGEENRLEFIKATIHTTTQGAEALAAVLSALGIEGLCVDDPADLGFIMASKDVLAWDYIGIEGCSREGFAENGEARVSFWLEKGAEAKLAELRIALLKLKSDEQYGLYGEGADFGRLWLETEAVTDEWKDKYKESFRPFSPCEGFFIVPPWDSEALAPGAGSGAGAEGQLKIVIDPGMAFGTGSHETTSMCLSKIASLIKQGDLMLDAGTGSGILAIAAALLGASSAHAFEIDEDAALSASRNIEANGVREKVSLFTCDIAAEGAIEKDVRYDLITANLSCSLLETLLGLFRDALKDEGAMILSGLLDAQEERALEALENAGLKAVEVVRNGEWLMIEARK